MTTKIEKPMLFSGAMIPRLQDDSKTQTRRICVIKIKDGKWSPLYQPKERADGLWADSHCQPFPCPHPVGSKIWVKETFCYDSDYDRCFYRADADEDGRTVPYQVGNEGGFGGGVGQAVISRWKPSIFMPKRLSRISLEVTQVRVERLQDISEEDAIAEGACPLGEDRSHSHAEHGISYKYRPFVNGYRDLWESINGKNSWSLNPWVFAYSFRRIKP